MLHIQQNFETLLLVAASVASWAAFFTGSVCAAQRLTVKSIRTADFTPSCLIEDQWIVPSLVLGIFSAVPSLFLCFLYFRRRKGFRGIESVGKAGRRETGFVRPSLFRQYSSQNINVVTPARQSLYVALGLTTVCDSMWELLLAVVMLQTFVDTFAPLAVIVLLSSISSTVFSPLLTKRISRSNRLSAIRSLLVVERFSMLTCIYILGVLVCYLIPDLEGYPSARLFVLNSMVTKARDVQSPVENKKSAGFTPTPKPNEPLSTLPPTALASSDTSGFFGNLRFVFPSWILKPLFPHSSTTPDPTLQSLLGRPEPDWDGVTHFLVLSLYVFSTLMSVARSARLSIIQKQWMKIVATSPFNNATSNNDQPLPHDVSAVGSLTHSDEDEDTSISSSRENPRQVEAFWKDTHQPWKEATPTQSADISPYFSARPSRYEAPEPDSDDFDLSEEFRGHSPRSSAQAQESFKQLRASLGQIHLMSTGCATCLFGFVLDLGSASTASIIGITTILMWTILSFIFESVAFRVAYDTDRALREVKPVVDSSVNFFDPYGTRSIYHPIGMRSSARNLDRFKKVIRAWGIYVKNPIFLASVAYAILFMTTFDGGLITMAYFRWRNVPAWIIGLIITIRSCSCGFVFLMKRIHRRTGSLARTTSFAFWVVWLVACPAAVVFVLAGSDSSSSLYAYIAAVLVFGPASRGIAVIHGRLVREWVEDQQLPVVLRCQAIMKLAMILAIHVAVLVAPSPTTFYSLVYTSVTACFLGVLGFTLWYKLFDSGTPFQVVDDIGQLVLVVRG